MSVDAAITALTEGAEPRTWSLIVTIFGDLARDPETAIPGPVLSQVACRIGLRPEAMRVALHRLRKDDWLVSDRIGRVSHYRLSPWGRAETARATTRIYAAAPPETGGWHVLVAGPMDQPDRLALDGDMLAQGYLGLGPGIWLGTGAAPDRPDLVAIDAKAVTTPDWLRATLLPTPLAEAYDGFAAALARANTALTGLDLAALPALDRAALRVLVVHGWRRLVLRHPDLPDRFFPDCWTGPATRAAVQDLLAQLGRPSVRAISAEATASVASP